MYMGDGRPRKRIKIKQTIFNILSAIMVICFSIILVGCLLWGQKKDAEIWNNGICPECSVKYENIGVYKSYIYYNCPECLNGVKRYVSTNY